MTILANLQCSNDWAGTSAIRPLPLSGNCLIPEIPAHRHSNSCPLLLPDSSTLFAQNATEAHRIRHLPYGRPFPFNPTIPIPSLTCFHFPSIALYSILPSIASQSPTVLSVPYGSVGDAVSGVATSLRPQGVASQQTQ